MVGLPGKTERGEKNSYSWTVSLFSSYLSDLLLCSSGVSIGKEQRETRSYLHNRFFLIEIGNQDLFWSSGRGEMFPLYRDYIKIIRG